MLRWRNGFDIGISVVFFAAAFGFTCVFLFAFLGIFFGLYGGPDEFGIGGQVFVGTLTLGGVVFCGWSLPRHLREVFDACRDYPERRRTTFYAVTSRRALIQFCLGASDNRLISFWYAEQDPPELVSGDYPEIRVGLEDYVDFEGDDHRLRRSFEYLEDADGVFRVLINAHADHSVIPK